MKLSLDWLSDFVDLTTKNTDEINRRLTAGIAEVDDIERRGAFLTDCCVGKVLTLAKHPNADRLNLCTVQTDKGVMKVVCGGTNLREGMKVAFAHVGATVKWHGGETMTLTKTKIRGEESEGMICAGEELEIAEIFPAKASDGERPIVDLGDGEEGVGQPLTEYLNMGDTVIHIDNHAITHRADLFSHVGFAREFVALGLAKWKKSKKQTAIKYTKDKIPFACKSEDKTLVPLYCSVILEIDGPGKTPAWMLKRLEAVGWRGVNLPVDITNYVATEQGMPLHAFDADDIEGDVSMRAAKANEKITTLDEVVRTLPAGAIVLSDKKGVFDLLGVMGGLRSSTTEKTRRIYLHAAIVDPVSIRKTVIATGHRTDASTVYEKGVPREAALRGLERAVELFLELVPGARVASKLEHWGELSKEKTITLPFSLLARKLGTEIPEKKVIEILESLAFGVKLKKGKDAQLTVTVPPHRVGDMNGPHDVVEEVGRVFGYDELPATMPAGPIRPADKPVRIHQLRDALLESGFFEILPISLVGPKLLGKLGMDASKAVAIRNPISEDTSLLHTSMLPSLLEHAERNLLLAGPQLRTFHWGHVFAKGQDEKPELSMLIANMTGASGIQSEPFYQLKQVLSDALDRLGLRLETSTAAKAPSYAHAGRAADIFAHTRTKSAESKKPASPLGMIFEIDPSVREQFGLKNRAAAVVLDLQPLLDLVIPPIVSSRVAALPAVQYDVTFTVSHREQVSTLLQQLEGADGLLEKLEIVDLFAGKPLKEDQVNVTVRFTYRSPERTLTEDEVKPIHDRILQSVEQKN